MSKENGFLRWESILGEDAVTIVEMRTLNLEYYINLVDKTVVRFERISFLNWNIADVLCWLGSNFERSSTVNKCYQTTLHATKKSFMKGKVSLRQHTSLLYYFKQLWQPPQPWAAATPTNQQPLTLRQNLPLTKRLWLSDSSDVS